MLNEEICKLRNKLNDSIVSGKDYLCYFDW